MTTPTFTLVHGAGMPAIGLGTYPMTDTEAATEVRTAIEAGYRLIDTAENYGNERGVGKAITDSGVPREELFITSKLNREWHSIDGVAQAWENSTKRLGVDYLDLFLIHWPNPDQDRYVEAWDGLTRLLTAGKVRAIGTSNFKPAHLLKIIDSVGTVPDVNQIQLSPYHRRRELVAFNRHAGILTQAWGPLKPAEILSDPVIIAIAAQHNVTPAQVVLRWNTQHSRVPIPKSSNLARQVENLNIFGFRLTDTELAEIDGLDRGEEGTADSDVFGH